MEPIIFTYKGKQFTITLGGIDAEDKIEVTYPNDSNTYVDILGDINKVSKRNKRVNIGYQSIVTSSSGEVLRFNGDENFDATTQETFSYFYDMITGNSKLGTTLDKMVIDGLLIDKYGLQQGVFGNDGNFYYPIEFETQVTEAGETDDIMMYNVLIDIKNPIDDEIYEYLIIETMETSNTSMFTLPSGTYTIMATSPKSMPYYDIITI